MKDLNIYIKEALKITKDSKVKNAYKYHPKNRLDLINCIREELTEQGPDADLNCIDTANVVDMSFLFNDVNLDNKYVIRNIDISEWNTSNVKDMYAMFKDCKKFNCDLSKWDVSNVIDMDFMFTGCKSLKNIPDWFEGKK